MPDSAGIVSAITSFETAEHRFLSNFCPSVIHYEGTLWPTVEHAYQQAKTTDAALKYALQACRRPSDAKRVGRSLVYRPGWDGIKRGVMLDLLRLKFEIPRLRDLLVKTGERDLIEGNTWGDIYWGVCNGVGENHLGKLLMKVRGEIARG